MKNVSRKIFLLLRILPITLLLVGIGFLFIPHAFWQIQSAFVWYEEVKFLPSNTSDIYENSISLQELKDDALELEVSARTLSEKEIPLLLAKACRESDAAAFAALEQQLRAEGLLLSGSPCAAFTEECAMHTPIICYDVIQDIWYLAGGGYWTKELTRKEAGIGMMNNNNGSEWVLLFMSDWERERVAKEDYFYYVFDKNGTPVSSYSGVTDGSGIGAVGSFDDYWTEEGYSCQSFGAVIQFSRNFVNSSGKACAVYIHQPAGAELRRLGVFRTSDGTAGISGLVKYPRKASAYFSDNISFNP